MVYSPLKELEIFFIIITRFKGLLQSYELSLSTSKKMITLST